MIVEGGAYLYTPTTLDKIIKFILGGENNYYEYVSKSVQGNKRYYSITGGTINNCGYYDTSGYGEEITEQQFNQFRQKAEMKWQKQN